jgi:oligopeptide transport system permease protein
MQKLIVYRTAQGLLTLFFIATCVFWLMHSAPGSPFLDEHAFNSDVIARFKTHYGLDLPIYQQYFIYLSKLLKGQCGPSLTMEGVNVSLIIKEAFPISFILGLLSFCFTLTSSLFLSLCIVLSPSKILKLVGTFLTSSCLALPSFVASALLQYLVAIKLHLLPLTGAYSLKHLILPALSLSLIPIGIMTKLLVSKLKEVQAMPYTLSAKTKGLAPFRFFIFHLLPGAVLPTLSYLGPLAATLMTGSFACEKVFALPGLGSWFVMSLNARDYPLIAGLTLFYSLFVIGFSLLVDLVSGFFDPKLKKAL